MKSKEQQHRTKNSTPKTFNHKNKLNNKEEEQPTKLKLKNKEQDCTTINKHTIRTHTNPKKNKEHNQNQLTNIKMKNKEHKQQQRTLTIITNKTTKHI